MKKSILNLGKILDKTEQKTVNGGFGSVGCYVIQVHQYGIMCSACCKTQGDSCVPDVTQLCKAED